MVQPQMVEPSPERATAAEARCTLLDHATSKGQCEPDADARALDAAVLQATDHLAEAAPFAVSLADIAIPDLPDAPLSAVADGSILKTVAALYLALELESTGLTRALSAVAGLYMSGVLRLGSEEVARLLLDHHRNYELRTPSDDRFAAYLRLFGTAPEGAVPFAMGDAINAGLEEAMLRLAEAMHRYANMSITDLSPMSAQREIRSAARLVGESLVLRGGGVSHYLAEEALGLISKATQVFSDRAVQRALGSRDLWSAVRSALNLQQGQARRPFLAVSLSLRARAHLTRGKAGMMLIEWIVREAPRLAGIGGIAIDRADPILLQGTAWLEATLTLLSGQESDSYAL